MPADVNPYISQDHRTKNCTNCLTRNHSLLNELSFEELQVLNKDRYCISYKAGEIICKEGAKHLGLLCLNSGKVKIIRNGTNGNHQIIALRKYGDFIGFRALMGERSYVASAIAMEDASICVISKKNFFKVIKRNKLFSFKIIQFFVDELFEFDNRLINLTQKHMRARLAEAILNLYEFYGNFTNNGYLNVKLKRSDLAALANMTTANAIRVLSSFANENLIDINKREIKINDLKTLKNISVFDK